MRRPHLATLTVFLLAAMLAVPAAGAQDLPAVAGHTRIVADGAAGIALRLPAVVAHSRHHYHAEITDGTFAYIHVVPESCPNLGIQGSCLSYYNILRPASLWFPDNELVQFDTVAAGRLEVYILSDGTVTLDMAFDELAGSADYVATDPIDARFADLGRDCPDVLPDCDNIGHGGANHTVGDSGGVVVAIGYAEAENQNTGSIAVQSCVSPGPRVPAGSSDPADHPDGCQFSTTGAGQDYLVNYAVRSLAGAGGFLTVETNPRATGPVYAGYRGHHVNPLFPGGNFAGYGVWITLGIPAP